MLKLLVTLTVALLLAMAMFGLRQHRREVVAQTTALHQQIISREQVMLGQHDKITRVSNPLMLAQNLKAHGLGGEIGVREEPAPVGGAGTGRTTGGRRVNQTDDAGDLLAPLRRRTGH